MTNFRKSVTPAQQKTAAATPLTAMLTEVAAIEPCVADSAPSAPATLRSGTKGAALLELLQRGEGASLDEMIERTGWLSHTVRAAMTGLRKKGHSIDKRVSDGTTVWFIAS